MVPRLTGPLSHWSPNRHPRTTHSIAPPPLIAPLPPTLIGISPPPPPPTHWSPNATLVIQFSLVPHPIVPPSLTRSTLFSLVPHLIGPPIQPWLYSSHSSPI